MQAKITVKCGLYNLHSQQAVALDSKRGEDAGPDSNPVNSLRAKAKDLFQEVTYSKMGKKFEIIKKLYFLGGQWSWYLASLLVRVTCIGENFVGLCRLYMLMS